jgi:hypothetical protein
VVGRSLEVLLQGAGYGTRIIEVPTTDGPQELLEGIRLVLVAPTPSTESRERFLAGMGSMSTVPVLTLSNVPDRVISDQGDRVLWPCRLEDLKSEIEAALIRASQAEVVTSSEWQSPDPGEGLPPGFGMEQPEFDGAHRRLGAV